MTREIKGILPIAPAVFDDRGEVDYEGYANAIRWLIQGGCPGVTLFGIAGEYYKLTHEEELKLIQITVEQTRKLGAVCIISNTRHATEAAVKWAQFIQDSGADCMMVLPPFFLKPDVSHLYAHMKQVSQAVNIPVMIQYAPEQTGVTIAPDILCQLSVEVPQIRLFKIECKPPGAYIQKLLQLASRPLQVFIGNAGFQMIEGFDRGAVGVMPGSSMFDLYLQIHDHLTRSKRESAFEIHQVLVYILNHIRQNVEMLIRFEKMILKKRKVIQSDYCRQPSHILDEASIKIFDELYERVCPYFVA